MPVVPAAPDLRDTILAAWRTNNRVTVFLVEHLSGPLWESKYVWLNNTVAVGVYRPMPEKVAYRIYRIL
jgi:hypothetical protein